jgi:hypothetical protein
MTHEQILAHNLKRIADALERMEPDVKTIAADTRQVFADNATLRVHCAEGPAHAKDRVRLRRMLRLAQFELGKILSRYELNANPSEADIRARLVTLDARIDTTLNRSYEPEKEDDNETR